MEHSCSHCDQPDSSLLRIVLIGEIIRAEDTTLYTMAEVLQSLGLLELPEGEELAAVEAEPVSQGKHQLRLVK